MTTLPSFLAADTICGHSGGTFAAAARGRVSAAAAPPSITARISWRRPSPSEVISRGSLGPVALKGSAGHRRVTGRLRPHLLLKVADGHAAQGHRPRIQV